MTRTSPGSEPQALPQLLGWAKLSPGDGKQEASRVPSLPPHSPPDYRWLLLGTVWQLGLRPAWHGGVPSSYQLTIRTLPGAHSHIPPNVLLDPTPLQDSRKPGVSAGGLSPRGRKGLPHASPLVQAEPFPGRRWPRGPRCLPPQPPPRSSRLSSQIFIAVVP